MKKSIAKNYKKIQFYTDSIVATCYATKYYGASEWRIRRNDAGEYVAYSSGAQHGFYPYIGRSEKVYAGSPWGGVRAKKISQETVAEMLKQAQTGRGHWAKYHSVTLVNR